MMGCHNALDFSVEEGDGGDKCVDLIVEPVSDPNALKAGHSTM